MDNRRGDRPAGRNPSAAEPGPGSWDRRAFILAAGVATGSLSALWLGTGAAHAAATPALPLHTVVVDSRFADGHAFAAEAARAGQRVAWIDRDVTNLWYDDLDLRWRDGKAAIAGLTEYGAFFCLERLAMDRGLRTVFKGEHRLLDSGAASHLITGPEAVVTSGSIAGLSDRGWAAQTARLAMAAHGAGPIAASRQATTRAGADQPPLLISWVLAPRPERQI